MRLRRARTNAVGGALSLALLGAILLAPALGRAAEPPRPVLVELFTSEGCSSCPPADRLLMELDRGQPVPGAQIIVLSEHVDYWNSLGWRDPFSSPQWSARQSEYSRHFALDSVYTPQMIIDGASQAVGNDSRAIVEAVRKSAIGPHLAIAVSAIERTGGILEVSYSADAAPHTTLYAVLADASDRSSVQRGENAGHTLDHVAVARSLTKLTPLKTAAADQKIEIGIPGDNANRHLRLILFAQDDRTGAILGAAEREL